jgi:hypothetical protein
LIQCISGAQEVRTSRDIEPFAAHPALGKRAGESHSMKSLPPPAHSRKSIRFRRLSRLSARLT